MARGASEATKRCEYSAFLDHTPSRLVASLVFTANTPLVANTRSSQNQERWDAERDEMEEKAKQELSDVTEALNEVSETLKAQMKKVGEEVRGRAGREERSDEAL